MSYQKKKILGKSYKFYNFITPSNSNKRLFIKPEIFQKISHNNLIKPTMKVSSLQSNNLRRKSLSKEPYKNPRLSLSKIFIEKEKEAEKKISNKKRRIEISYLCKERAKLQKLLILTKDASSLRLLSQKILKLNLKISKLIGINKGTYEIKEKKKKLGLKKKLKSKTLSDSEEDYSENEEKIDNPFLNKIHKINNKLKINEIYKEGEIIDIHTVISTIKDKPSSNFIREKDISSLFYPNTEYSKEKRKFGNNTIYLKNFRPIGFTNKSILDNENKQNYSTSIDDIFYKVDEKLKRKNSYSSNFRKKTFDKNESSYLGTTTNSINSKKKNKIKHTIILPKKKINKFLNITQDNNNYYLINNSDSKLNIINNSMNEGKSKIIIKSKIKEILNDTNLIKESLEKKIEEESEKPKKKNDNILLELSERLSKKKFIPRKKKNELLSLENEYVRKLKKIPRLCKREFRECFKKIINEDRILNKPDQNEINLLEEKLRFISENNKFKVEGLKTMYLLKDNIVTGKEDDEIIKGEKIFGNYGNISGLEWLLKKKFIMYDKEKLSGAYNPKEKHIHINYPI